jgi:hypothetical protein
MDDDTLIAALSCGTSLALLLILINLMHDAAIDDLRDRLFAIRDRMFLYAYDHDLLDRPAHRELRSLMNGAIRFAHQASVVRVLSFALASRIAGRTETQNRRHAKLIAAIHSLPSAHRDYFSAAHEEFIEVMALHIIRNFTPLWPVYIVTKVAYKALDLADRLDGLRNSLRAKLIALLPIEAIEDEAARAI